MTGYKQIGKITKEKNISKIHWDFPFDLLKHEEVYCLKSPPFRLEDSSWYLTLYPDGCDQCKGWISLFLHSADNRYPKSIYYTLVIDTNNQHKTFSKTGFFNKKDDYSGQPRLIKTPRKVHFQGILRFISISCKIKDYSYIPLQETPSSVSCAIQTEIPDSGSCAVQTEVPDSESCEVQTKIPDSVIHKENSNDQDGSSLDTKEVTILRDHMKELLIKGSDYDVTICVQNKKFRAHRIILRARSPVFAMMLTHDTKESNTGTITIEDCDPDIFDEFLLYVYSGKTGNLPPSKALQLYYIADKYDFPVLKEQCVNLLKTSLSITSFYDVVLLSEKHQEKELLEVASEFFARNMEEILASLNWQNFVIQNPVEANELYIRSMEILLPTT